MEARSNNSSSQTQRSRQTQQVLTDLLRALKKRIWAGLIVAVVVAIGYYIMARHSYVPSYRTSSTFTVTINNNYGASTKVYNNATAKQMAKTFPYILQSGILGDLVAADLGFEALPATVAASANGDTNLFTLTVTGGDPKVVYDVLQSVIRNYPQVAEFVVGSTNLELLYEDGVPTAPINRVSWKTAVMWGAVAGVLVCAGLVALYMMLHQTVHRVDDLKDLAAAKCLAVLPQVTRKKRNRERRTGVLISQKSVPRGFVEAIYRVRTGVESLPDEARVLLLTSALPGEGKTTVSVNLALSLAKKGKRVILIDGDLRRPSVSRYLRLPEEAGKVGLGEYLKGQADVENIGYTISNMNNLVVIPGGASTGNPSELLASKAMEDLLKMLRAQADYVILDSPPCASMTDSAVAGKYTDGVIFVVKQDYASRDRILQGIENATSGGNPLVGTVLNSASYSLMESGYGGYYYGRYGYGYGYGYGYSHYSGKESAKS